MRYARLAVAFLTVGALGACSDSSGPNSLLTARATDPSGDTYGNNPVQWDLTAMTITHDTGGITVQLDFTSNVKSPATGDTTATIGFVDFDVDQNSSTGFKSIVDDFRPGTTGSTGMGVDYELDFTGATATVFDSLGNSMGSVTATYSGTHITFRVPRARLGNDDAFLNAAAIVGTNAEPTDIVPENGHLKVGGTGTVAPMRPGLVLQGTVRKWGGRQ